MTSYATAPQPARAIIAAALCLALTGAYLHQALGPFTWLSAPEARAVGGYDAVGIIGQIDTGGTGAEYLQAGTNSGPTNEFLFSAPKGMAMATYFDGGAGTESGTVYFADNANNRVVGVRLEYSCGDGCAPAELGSQSFQHVLGQPDFRSNTAGVSDAEMDGPTGVAVGGDYLFIADTNNNRILAFELEAAGEREPVDGVADFVIGQSDFDSNTPGLASVSLDGPTYLTSIASGSGGWTGNYLFVTDTNNNRVLGFNIDSLANGMGAEYVLGQPDFDSNAPALSQTGMDNPTGIAYLHPGYIYGPLLFVADTNNNRVLAFDARPEGSDPMSSVGPQFTPLCDDDTSGIANGVIAACVLGQTDFVSSTGGLDADSFSQPAALGAGYQKLYVGSYTDQRVMVFSFTSIIGDDDGITTGESAVDALGGFSFTVIDQCDTTDEAPCASSIDVAEGIMGFDEDGSGAIRILVADTNQNRVIKFQTSVNGAGYVDADDLLGQYDWTSEERMYRTTSAVNAFGVSGPGQLALWQDSVLYLADTGNSRVLGYSMNGSDLDSPLANWVYGQGSADENEFGVRWYEYESGASYEGPSRSNIVNWADEDCGGGLCDTVGSPNDYNLNAPSGVAWAWSGGETLFVLDAENSRVQRFDSLTTGDHADASVAVSSTNARHIAYNADDGHLYVPAGAAGGEITVYDVDLLVVGSLSSPVPGDPYGIAYDSTSGLVFASAGDCVYSYDVSGGAVGQGPDAVLGDTSMDCSGGGGTDTGHMVQPLGVAVDDGGERLFVADSLNNRVVQFDISDGVTDGEEAVEVYGQDDLVSGGSGTTQSSLDGPAAVLYVPAADQIYVSDTNNNRVLIFDAVVASGPGPSVSPHVATDVLGQLKESGAGTFLKGGANDGPNLRGMGPDQSAVDTVHHRLFVSDQGDGSRILVFNLDSSDELQDNIPDFVFQVADFTTVPEEEDSMDTPFGIAYDEVNNRLFVAAFGFCSIQVFDTSTLVSGLQPTNTIGECMNEEGDNFSDTAFGAIHGLAYDSANERLFAGDQDNSRVLVFDLSGGITDGMPASSVLGQPDLFTADDCALDAVTICPAGDLAYDSTTERLFVVAMGTNSVRVFDVADIVDGEPAVNVLGQPNFSDWAPEPTSSASLLFDDDYRGGLAIDEAGQRLFVADSTNTRVVVYDITTIDDGEGAVSVLGQADFTSNGEAVTAAGMTTPVGLGYNPTANKLYVSDENRLLVFDVAAITNGEDAVDVLGQLDANDDPLFTKNGANNGPNRQGFDMEGGANVALDVVHDRIFVPDFIHNRILVFNRNSDGSMPDRDPDFVLGQPDFTSFASATSATGLWGPTRVAYDGCQPPDCSSAHDLLYVADATNSRVLVYDTTTITNGEAAIAVLGQPDFDTTGGGTSATQLNSPQGVSVEPLNGILAVADVGNNRVVAFDLDTDTGLPLDGTADRVVGQVDFDSNSAGLSITEMDSPNNVLAETNTDSLWVADSNNNRVLRFDLFGGSGDSALNVLGQPDFDTNNANTTQSGMDFPTGLALLESDDTDQRLFVGDLNNSRVLVFNTGDGIDDGEDAVDVYGQGSFEDGICNIDDDSVGDTTLCNADGADYDEVNTILYVADRSNNRVMIFGPAPSGGSSDNNPSPPQIGFTPLRIEVNDEQVETDSRNVLVKIYATSTDTFTGTVDILLSNDPRFATFIPFRYVIPEKRGNQTTRDIWPKTMAWDLCFGLEDPDDCDPGRKVVYARFYVNVPAPTPQLLPTPETAIEHPDPTP